MRAEMAALRRRCAVLEQAAADVSRTETTLRESEGRLRTIQDKVQTGILIIDPASHTIVDVNPAAATSIGAPPHEIIGRRCFRFVCPAEEGRCPITDLRQEIDNSERVLLRTDRTARQIIKTAVPLMLDGRAHILESFVDITEQKESEERLRRQSDHLAAVQAASAEITQELDLPTLLTLIHKRATELLGTGMGTVFLWDEANQILVPQVRHGYGGSPWRFCPKLGEGVSGTVAQRREGMFVNDFRSSPYATPALLECTTHVGTIAEPLLYRGRLLGVISVDNPEPARRFTEEDQHLLRPFATQAAIAIENARLYAEAQGRQHEAGVFADLIRSINASPEVDTVLQQVADAARGLCRSDLASISLRDSSSRILTLRYRAGSYCQDLVGYPIGEGQGIGGTVLATGMPFRTASYAEDPRISKDFLSIALAEGISAQLAVPIWMGDDVEGILSISNRNPRPFTDADESILRRLAGHAAIAIQNARLFTAAHKSRQMLQLVLDTIPQRVFWKDRDSGFLGCNRAYAQDAGLNNPDAILGQMDFAFSTKQDAEAYRTDDRRVMESGIAKTGYEETRLTPEGHTVWHRTSKVPLADAQGIVVGVLGTYEDITDQKRAEMGLVERTRQLEALRTLGEEITRELDLTRLLELLVRRAAELVNAAVGAAFLWNEEAQTLVPHAAYGPRSDELSPCRLGDGLAGTVAQRRESIFTNDYQAQPYAVPRLVEPGGPTAALAAPLLYRGRLLGVLALHDGETGHRFEAQDRDTLALFASQAAIAIENAWLFAAAQHELAIRAKTEEILKRYQMLADHARDIILFLRPDGCILEANHAAVAAYGYHAEELLRLNVRDLRAETHPVTDGQLEQVGTDGLLFETVHRRRDGSAFPVEVSSRSTTIGGERVILGLVRDITLRKQAQDALADRTRQLEAVRAITMEITRELDLTRLLELVMQRAVDLVGANQSGIMLWDESQQLLVPKAWTGSRTGRLLPPRRLGEGVTGTAAQLREGLIVNDFRTSPYATPTLLALSAHTAVLTEPLLYRDRLVGVISLDRNAEMGPFREEDRRILALFADQAAIAIENARLYEAALQKSEQLEALLRASQSVMAGLDLQSTLQQIASEAAGIARCELVKLLLADSHAELLRVGVVHGYVQPEGFPLSFGVGFSGLVAQSRAPLYVADVQADPRNARPEQDRALDFRSYLGLPVSIHDKLLGVLTFNTTTPRVYTAAELAYLTSFAGQAAIAIENAQLYESVRRELAERTEAERVLRVRTRQLEAIGLVSAEITRELDLTRLLGLIHRRAAELLGARSGFLFLYDESTQTLIPRAWEGHGEWAGRLRFRLGEGISGFVAARRMGMVVTDYRTSHHSLPPILDHSRFTSAVAEPLIYRDRLVGVVAMDNEGMEERTFAEEDREILALFATQAAIAIENARLHAGALRRAEELEALLRATRSLMSGLDLEGILDRILAEAATMVGTAHVRVTLVDRAAGVLRVARVTGDLVAPGTEYPLESLSGLVVTSGEPVFSPQVATDPRAHFGSRYAEFGIVTYLGLPIKIRGEVFGILIISTTEPREYPPEELAYLTSFADYAAIAIENARLFAAAERAATEARSLYEVAHSLTTSLDPTEILQLIAVKTTDLLETPHAQVVLWEEATQSLRLGAAYGSQASQVQQQVYRLGHGINGIVAQTRAPLIVNDYQAFPQRVPERTEIVAAIAVPLLYRGRFLGILTSHATRPGAAFTQEHLALLTSFANQAAVAIENARLHDAAVRRGEELEALLRSTRTVMSGLDLPTTLKRITLEASRISRCEHVKLLLVDREARLLRISISQGHAAPPGFPWPIDYSLSGRVVRTGQPVFLADSQDASQNPNAAYDRATGLRTYLGLPIKAGGEVLGVLTFNTTEPYEYSPEELTYLTSFADQAAIAIENARLYEETRQALAERIEAEAVLARRTQQLEAVRTISEEIIRELDLPGVLNLIASHAVALVGATSGGIRLWNPERQMLVPAAETGSVRHAAEVSLRLGDGVVGTAAAQRRGLIVNEFRTSAYATPLLLEGTTHTAVMATPLLYGERLVGVLGVTREQTEPPFTERDLEFLSLLAPQAAIAIENARLHEATVRRGAQLEALLSSLQTVTSGLDLREILDRILGEAIRISGAPHVKVLLRDKADNTLRVGALRGSSMPPADALPAGASLSGLVVQSGEPLFIADAQNDPRNLWRDRDRELEIVTYLGLPIKKGEEVLGVLTFNNTSPYQYTPEEMILLTSFADQAAIAIENARLYEETRQALVERIKAEAVLARRTQQLEAVRTISEEITRELHLPDLLKLIVERARVLLQAERCTVRLWNEQGQCLDCPVWSGLLPAVTDRPLQCDEGISGVVARRRQGLIVNDYAAFPHAITEHPSARASMAYPLRCHDQLLGVIVASRHIAGPPFLESDLHILRLVSDQAAIAVENAHLYQAVRRELVERTETEGVLARRTQQLEAVRAVSAEITQELEVMVVLDLIDRRASELVGVHTGTIFLWDEASNSLVREVWHGYEDAEGLRRLPLGEGVAGAVAQLREGLIVNDFRTSPYVTPWFLEHTTHTAVLAEPLVCRGRLLGVIALNNFGIDRLFTSQDQEVLRLFAAQAAVAIENARLFAQVRTGRTRLLELTQQLVSAQEEERARLSRELHDEAGQALTALRIGLGLIQEDLPPNASALRQRLRDALTAAESITDHVRLLAQALRPPALDALGLEMTLEGLCRDFGRRTRLTIDYTGSGLPAVSDDIAIHLYRFLQEALTNIGKHAQAHRVRVTLEYDGDTIRLSVEDDGAGFDIASRLEGTPPTGIGLLGMRERFDLLKGQLEIDSQPGRGTRLVARVPWKEAA